MNLRTLAQADTALTLEGDGVPMTLTAPDGVEYPVTGAHVDIGQTVDPDTGVMVSGRSASAAVRIAALPVIPRGMAESSGRPWLLVVDGLKYKIAHSNPDRSLGVVVLLLEGYK